MVKAIIFDCFGVIYPDTLALVERPFLGDDDTRRQRIRLLRQQCDIGKISRDDFWDKAAQIMGITRQKLDNELKKVQKADWELLGYIKQLKTEYKTALLSNVGKGFIERIFIKDSNQDDYFSAVIISADIGVMKPDPRAFEAILLKLEVRPEECIFVDDRIANCEGAKKIGMKTIHYTDYHQAKKKLESLLAK